MCLFKELLARSVLLVGEKLSLIQLESSSLPSMQSDRRLRSSSVPDQRVPNIKLSERPLDSIVTNEGPSKRSCVAVSSSNRPSESRVYPAVESFVQRLANDSICRTQIDKPSSSDELISILGEEFDKVATILESYLSRPDDHRQIRSKFRYTACYPSTFVHILLLSLLPGLTHEHFDPSLTNDTYSAFCYFVQHAVQPSISESTYHSSPSPTTELHPAYPRLQQDLADIRKAKKQHQSVATGFVNSKVLNNLHIHRLKSTNLPSHTQESLGKKVVLDCPDFDKFPETKYIIMSIRNVAISLVLRRMICLHKHICWSCMTSLLPTQGLENCGLKTGKMERIFQEKSGLQELHSTIGLMKTSVSAIG